MSELFGPDYSRSYDAFYKEKDYSAEVDLLEGLFTRHSVHRVLDLGCGTGGHTIELTARGYDVVGVDRSPSMLAIARTKAGKAKVAPRFLCADVRSLILRERFDAVISMFAVVGYQHEDDDVVRMFDVVDSHLVPGGLFVFDVWFGPAVIKIRPSDRVLVRSEGDVDIVRTSSGQLREDGDLCDVRMGVWEVRSGELRSGTSEVHTMRFFFPDPLERLLRKAHLSLERLGGFPDIDQRPSDETWNVVAVASKP